LINIDNGFRKFFGGFRGFRFLDPPMSTGSHRNQVPHFILPLITRCPALFSRIFFPAFYRLLLPHPALPLFTHSLKNTLKSIKAKFKSKKYKNFVYFTT